jgi:hypothetical protein
MNPVLTRSANEAESVKLSVDGKYNIVANSKTTLKIHNLGAVVWGL